MNNDDVFKILFESSMKESDGVQGAANSVFEVFYSFIKAGFNEKQALYIVGEILKGGMNNGEN